MAPPAAACRGHPPGARPAVRERGSGPSLAGRRYHRGVVAEKIFAGIVLLVCALLLLRLVIGERRRWRYDAFWRRLWAGTRIRALRLWHWRAASRKARHDADEAIRRARGRNGGEWDGNVYKPKSFDDKRDKRNLH